MEKREDVPHGRHPPHHRSWATGRFWSLVEGEGERRGHWSGRMNKRLVALAEILKNKILYFLFFLH